MRYLKILRLGHWYKNLVVFTAILFDYQFFNKIAWIESIVVFISFLFISNAGYIINDLHDKDRVMIGKKESILEIIVLILIGLVLAWIVNIQTLVVCSGYLILTTSYTYWFKKDYYLGLGTKAFGFALRAIAGCTALSILPSGWLLSCIFIIAMIMDIAKREKEEGLKELTIGLFAVYASYVMYQKWMLWFSVIPAGWIIWRYFKLQPHKHKPEDIVKNKWIVCGIGIWIISVVIGLYFIKS